MSMVPTKFLNRLQGSMSTWVVAAAAPIMLTASAAFFVPSAQADISDADFAKAMDNYLAKEDNVEKISESLKAFLTKQQAELQKKAANEEAANIERQIKDPVKIEVGSSPVKGPASASITIIEFSDFQCPYCKRGADVMEELLKKYPNDVRVVFKHYPLPFHPEAKGAGRASIAAGKQGKFWEMHDKLFNSQEALSEANYVKFAQELGLNMDKFKADMASPEAEKTIEADMALAQKHGVQGTPGFFVNGVQVRGARPVQYFEQLIGQIKAAKK